MTKKKRALLGALLLVILYGTVRVIGITGWGNSVLFPVSQASRELMAPLLKAVNTAVLGIQDFFGYFEDNKALRLQNEEMEKTLSQMEETIHKLKEQELENKRLHALLNYQEDKSLNYNLSMAKVIGRDPSNWYKTVIIDRGYKQGIQAKMTVITHQGLVGTVINTSANTAEVLLILDGEGAVGARVFDNRVTPGVVIGDGYSDILKMAYLSHNAEIEKGQTIVTSGLGGLYPKGIRIGRVEKVELEPNGLTKTAIIRPFVDFSRLEEVFVILQVKMAEEDYESNPVIPADSMAMDGTAPEGGM